MARVTEINALVAHQEAEGGIALTHEVVDESFLTHQEEGTVDIAVEYSGVRRELWRQIESALLPAHLDRTTSDISVLDVPGVLRAILHGGVTGRTRVAVRDGF